MHSVSKNSRVSDEKNDKSITRFSTGEVKLLGGGSEAEQVKLQRSVLGGIREIADHESKVHDMCERFYKSRHYALWLSQLVISVTIISLLTKAEFDGRDLFASLLSSLSIVLSGLSDIKRYSSLSDAHGLARSRYSELNNSYRLNNFAQAISKYSMADLLKKIEKAKAQFSDAERCCPYSAPEHIRNKLKMESIRKEKWAKISHNLSTLRIHDEVNKSTQKRAVSTELGKDGEWQKKMEELRGADTKKIGTISSRVLRASGKLIDEYEDA
mmetsp:Transcript_5320/g.10617  ORF Transcript_5320/g.10617 Transcript_5320/m.10617 type:complete len:270 (+) Transcript_5320:63-872(+)